MPKNSIPVCAAAAALCLTFGAAPAARGEEPAAAATAVAASEPGVWQEHKFSFRYMGFTSTYSCEGLADQLKVLLIAAGARGDLKSKPGACANGFGRADKFANADLTFHTLAPLGANPAAQGARADGAWRQVQLLPKSPRQLAIGDCELVSQFRDQVLPMFATRNIDNKMTCVPHQESGSNIDLKFEVFAAVPVKPAAAPAP